MSYLLQVNKVSQLCQNADHFDAKTIEGEAELREFLAGMFSYYPAWIKALYGIRWGFVRLLGMKQENFSKTPQLRPEDIPFEAGKWATFFKVEAAEEEKFWIASATDKHLSAYIVVAAEDLKAEKRRFHVGTIVHYHNWAGPVYFNVIRPFHHIVVSSMMRAGIA
jgi:hypothetical protein